MAATAFAFAYAYAQHTETDGGGGPLLKLLAIATLWMLAGSRVSRLSGKVSRQAYLPLPFSSFSVAVGPDISLHHVFVFI